MIDSWESFIWLKKTSHHQSTSLHGSGAVSSALHVDSMEEDHVRMATELTRQANQMHEMQLELPRIATTTSQAEERAKVAEEKACAAVMAIGMVKTAEKF